MTNVRVEVITSRRGHLPRRSSSGLAGMHIVESLGLEMRIPAQHLPVFVPGDERNVFDREACFE
jgi:hypothetical protein